MIPTSQINDLLRNNPKLAFVANQDDLQELLSGMQILHQEILYYVSSNMNKTGFDLYTTDPRGLTRKQANIFAVDKGRSQKTSTANFKMIKNGDQVNTKDDLIIERNSPFRLVRSSVMGIDLSNPEFIKEVQAFKDSKRETLNNRSGERKSLGSRLWSLAKTGALIGAGYILLKRLFNGSECVETWIHRDDLTIANESGSLISQRKQLITIKYKTK